MTESREILNYFRILDERSSLGTSYIFIGEDFSIVSDILKVISCEADAYFCNECWDCKRIETNSHPDLFIIEPESLTIKIDTIREGMRFLSLKSFQLKNKMVVIKSGNSLTPQAANAFLKTLEEPPKNSFIAICASKLEGILPTIISRCRKIFLPARFKESDVSEFSLVSEFLRGKSIVFKDRKKFSSFLWTLIILLHNDLLSKVEGRNNQLHQTDERKIIFKSYSVDRAQNILKDILKIYEACNNININLALNLIRLRL